MVEDVDLNAAGPGLMRKKMDFTIFFVIIDFGLRSRLTLIWIIKLIDSCTQDSAVWKNEKLTLIADEKIFREINSLVKTLLSRIFLSKYVRVNFRTFQYTLSCPCEFSQRIPNDHNSKHAVSELAFLYRSDKKNWIRIGQKIAEIFHFEFCYFNFTKKLLSWFFSQCGNPRNLLSSLLCKTYVNFTSNQRSKLLV